MNKKLIKFNPNDYHNLYKEFSREAVIKNLDDIKVELEFMSLKGIDSIVGKRQGAKLFQIKLVKWRKIFEHLLEVMNEFKWDYIKVANSDNRFDPTTSNRIIMKIFNPRNNDQKYELRVVENDKEIRKLLDQDNY